MLHKHPKALAYLTTCYSFFMIGFVIIVASLVLYQTNALNIPAAKAYAVFSAAIALLWILPLLGGYLSSKFGYFNGGKIGLFFCGLGLVFLCVPHIMALYLGMAFFVVGNAFATPAIWCLVDHCYPKTSDLREAGFTLFYLFFNVGGIFGVFLGGYLAEQLSYSYEFGIGMLSMFGSFVFLHLAERKMQIPEGRSIDPQVDWDIKKIWSTLFLICIASVPISAFLFDFPEVNNILSIILLFVMIIILGRIAYKQEEIIARTKMVAFIILSCIAIVFWTLYSLEPSFLSIFIQNNVQKTLLGIDVPTTSYFAFDGVFVVLIGLYLSRLWVYLTDYGYNPPLSLKFALSLILIGLGYGLIALVTSLRGSEMISSWWIVLAYAIFAFAELLVSPLGISMVGSLAPEGKEGVMMGFWQLGSGIGGILAGYIGIFTKLPSKGEALSISNPIYSTIFFYVCLSAVIAGLLVLPFVRKLYRLMRESSSHEPHL